jgi:putative transposase
VGVIQLIGILLRVLLANLAALAMENLALRQQLAVLERSVTFHILYCFVILCHDRRRVAHFNVTTHPTAEWTARQVIQAFPYEEAPRFLLRDRDRIYGAHFRECLKHFEIEEVKIAPRAPWQNPYVKRLIGSIRRECLDHVIVLNEDHLHRILKEYFAYYHHVRTHLAPDRDFRRYS